MHLQILFQIETLDGYRGNPIDSVTITAKIISKGGELRHHFGMITVYGRELTRADDVRSYERVSFAHFFKTNLANANLSGINLSYINFNHANAENADFSNSVLVHTKLEHANLKNANFQNSYLYKTNFTNADLSGADFSGAEIFDNVILNGAILDCINHPICN